MRLNKIVFLYFISLFFSYHALAQQKKLLLRDVLRVVEGRHDVSFTFLDKHIKGLLIEDPSDSLSLSEVVSDLQQKTGLIFTRLDQRFITISKPATLHITICGVLVDKETKEKIPGAVIRADEKFTLSNKEGHFELSGVREGSFLSVKSLGYEDLSIEANVLVESPCKTISLQLQISTLPEVIITYYLTDGIRKKIDGSLSIKSKELGILPGLTEPDVLFTIQALPGIQSIDETVSTINVRGGTHDQNLVLWDGMKMYQQGHFFGLISAFNPYLTKEVSLIKNGTSAVFSDGVSSTIDIRSDDEVTRFFTGGAGINMINGDVFAKIPVSKKSSLHIATRRSIADVIQTPTYRAYYDRAFRGTDVASFNSNGSDTISTRENFHFYDLNAKFLYDISDKDKLRVNFLKIYNSIEYEENALVNSVIESRISSLNQENTAAGISYTRVWSPEVRTSGQLYLSSYNLDAVNFDILNDQRLIQGNEVLDMGLKLDANVALSGYVNLFSGYQFFEVGVSNLEDINNPVFYRFKKNVLRTHVIFTEINYNSPSNATNIRAGIRASLFSKFEKLRIEPRLSVNQKLNDSFSLELLGEMKSQTTTQIIDFQNDFLGVEKRRWVLANEQDIPILTSKQLSGGVHFNKRNFLVSLEGYHKWVDGIITSSQGFQNQFQFVRSTGSYTSTGLDLLINRRIRKINAWVSYSYANSTFSFKELIPPEFPSNLDIRHRATWGISYQSNHVDLSFGINWHTGRPFTEPLVSNNVVGGEIQYQNPNSSRLQKYWRVDLSAKYKFNLSNKVRAVAGFSVWNVLNHNNVVDAFYRVNDADEIDFFHRSALGFTPNIMFRVEF